MRLFVTIGLVFAVHPAAAERHIVEPGETLAHVARGHGCSVGAVLRANGLDTTLVPPGTVVTIPACGARPAAARRPAGDHDDRARRALEVIDGAAFVKPAKPERDPESDDGPSASVGAPWRGELRGGEAMPRGDGYRLRRPNKSFGTSHVVGHLRGVIAEVRALHPDVHTLAIGDLSARHGGKLDRHVSHQSGLDVDIGFYYTKVPADYPEQFVAANADLDLEATWALIVAFGRTSRLSTGVQLILLDHDVQARLYYWARKRGTPDAQLAEILQYPRDDNVGLVRHWPGHRDHMHVRFKSQ